MHRLHRACLAGNRKSTTVHRKVEGVILVSVCGLDITVSYVVVCGYERCKRCELTTSLMLGMVNYSPTSSASATHPRHPHNNFPKISLPDSPYADTALALLHYLGAPLGG